MSKRILYITNRISGPGGLERVLSIKASYFADELGYDVHILTLNETSDNFFFSFSPRINHHTISVEGNPISYILNYRNGIKAQLKKLKPDIVIVCDDGLKGMFLPVLVKKNCPFIYERHVSKLVARGEGKKTLYNRLTTGIKYAMMAWGGKHFDAFVVLTNGNLKEWKLNNLKVISNPLPFVPGDRSSLSNKTVIAIGKHCYQKGYDRLLKCWKSVNEVNPDWNLEIYGSFHPDHDLEKMAHDLGIAKSIKLIPPVKDIKERILDASIHVLPSRYEGFGMVIIEAMSCGVPSIAFDCPFGPSDIIEHGQNGLLVDNDDLIELTNSLVRLIEKKDLRAKMGDNAFKSVDRYLMSAVANEWVKLFDELTHTDKTTSFKISQQA